MTYRPRYARVHTADLEHFEQKTLIEWTVWTEREEFEMLWAYPAGGKRPTQIAKQMKEEGQKPHVPDLFLSIPKWIGASRSYLGDLYHGLYIEMKVGKEKPNFGQRRMIDRLRECGYRVEVCYSAYEAAVVLVGYLGLRMRLVTDYPYFPKD